MQLKTIVKILLLLITVSTYNLYAQSPFHYQYTVLSPNGGGQGEFIRNLKYNNGPGWGIDFYTGYTRRMTLREGNLGIGTENPMTILHLKSNNPAIRIEEFPTFQDPVIHKWDIVGGNYFAIRRVADSYGNIYEALHIVAMSLSVGIGRIPSDKLTVDGQIRAHYGTSNNYIEIGNNGTHGFMNKSGTGDLDFRIDNTSRMRLLSNGNLAIGVTNPNEKLQVGGKVKADVYLLKKYSHNNILYRSTSASAAITGIGNTFAGADAGLSTTSGSLNVNFGSVAGNNITTGEFNTSLGYSAGYGTGSGKNNVHLGAYAGQAVQNKNGNVVIGAYTDAGEAEFDHSVFMGYRAGRSFEGTDLLQRITGQTVNKKSLFIVNNQANVKNPLLFGYFGETTNPDDNATNFVTGTMSQLGINTYELVNGCALTTKGAVHISPFNSKSIAFNYDSHIPDYLLWVERGIVSENFIIRKASAWNSWPDYVFDENYDLPDLMSLKKFVTENRHLPGVTTRDEVSRNKGYMAKELDEQVLKKIEEVMLYTIQQEEVIRKLQVQLEQLMQEINVLRSAK